MVITLKNKKLNCYCVCDCLASCMPTNACDCRCCVLGFSSPLSLIGTVAVIEVDITMLLLLPILVWRYGFEIEEWTNAIKMRDHLSLFKKYVYLHLSLVKMFLVNYIKSFCISYLSPNSFSANGHRLMMIILY